MDLSIIILTINNKKILEGCIDSIYKHTKSLFFEIIVVDNGSTDGTQNLIKTQFPNITLIENGRNLGFSRGNNKGLKIAKGRYALILNNDTYINRNSFAKVVEFMDQNPEVGICGPKLLNVDGTIQKQGSILTFWKWYSRKPLKVDMVIGASMFIRMSITNKIGLFDENLFFYNDDLDICKRASAAGYNVVYFPYAEVYHYGGFSSKGKQNYTLMIEGFRGGLYFCKKYYGSLAYTLYRIVLGLYISTLIPFSIINKKALDAYLNILRIIIKGQIIPETLNI